MRTVRITGFARCVGADRSVPVDGVGDDPKRRTGGLIIFGRDELKRDREG
jgi:hypothetical protein